MSSTLIPRNEILFHSSHGVCRVSRVLKDPVTEENSYVLIPAVRNKAGVSFSIPASAMEESGFHKVMTSTEGKAILSYLATGKGASKKTSQAWSFAKLIRNESLNLESVKSTMIKQDLFRAMCALAHELAYVLEVSIQESALQIQQRLQKKNKMHPLAQSLLSKVTAQRID